MHKTLFAASSALALITTSAVADGHLLFTPGEGAFSWDSLDAFAAGQPDLSGQTVTIAGLWLGPQAEAAEAVMAYFEDATGADVVVGGSDSFEPGLMCDLARSGQLADMGADTAQWMTDNYAAGQSWTDLGGCAGADGFFGFSYNVNVKSLVWYSPENFEDAGYDIPSSMEELKALTQ